ncbi:MAG: TonB-dependent receptor plug domain-containing protein, partial [Bacteroidota bacterium]
MKTKSLAVLLLLTPLAGWSQTMAEAQLDTILRLPEASITSNRVNYFSSGTTIEKMDKELLAMNRTGSLSELFSSHSNLQVNSYGPGGMSSISIRGGKTRNTAVLWNGLNLQS